MRTAAVRTYPGIDTEEHVPFGRCQPSATGRGLTLSLAVVWSSAGGQTERLGGDRDARALGPGGEFEAKAKLETEVRFGLGVPGTLGVVTPTPDSRSRSGDGARKHPAGRNG